MSAILSLSNSIPQKPALLPMQIRHASAEGFSAWLRERAVDLNSVQHRNRTRNFLTPHEFFEPYDSFRFRFDDPSDDDAVIYQNLSSLGSAFE